MCWEMTVITHSTVRWLSHLWVSQNYVNTHWHAAKMLLMVYDLLANISRDKAHTSWPKSSISLLNHSSWYLHWNRWGVVGTISEGCIKLKTLKLPVHNQHFVLRTYSKLGNWREGSMNICYSCKAPEFSSQEPSQVSPTIYNSHSGRSNISAFHGHSSAQSHTHIHTIKINIWKLSYKIVIIQ